MHFTVFINTECDFYVEKIVMKSGKTYDFNVDEFKNYNFLKKHIGKNFLFSYTDGSLIDAILINVGEENDEPFFEYDFSKKEEEDISYE
jgi:hypothetical protein